MAYGLAADADDGPAGATSLFAPMRENVAVRFEYQQSSNAFIEHDPSDHYAHHVLGRTLERAGRFSEALPHLRLAAAMKQHDDYSSALQRVETWVGKHGGRAS